MIKYIFEASRGAAAQSVTVKPTGCGFDLHSRNFYFFIFIHIFALVLRQSAALSSATQHAMPPESGRKWETECLNIRFPLPNLLCAGYSVKLKLIKYILPKIAPLKPWLFVYIIYSNYNQNIATRLLEIVYQPTLNISNIR